MTTTKQYDNLDRLTSISSLNPQLSTLSSFSYGYNSANQRITRTDGDNTHWNFGYDFLGQVTNGTKYWADNTPVPGEQFQYTFDNIGNRTNTLSGGDQFGGSLLLATYTANDLNQYSSRTVPSGVEILGIANVQASVTVNGISNAYRRGEFFQKTLTATNTNSPVWLTATSTSTLGTASSSVTGSLFVPQSPENYTYDADGNLLSDGRFSYTWDAENRLIRVVSATSAGPQQAIWFDYDYQGRRIRKRLWNSTTATNATPTLEQRFVYDGWNLIAILDANNTLQQSFVWGADLSGSIEGAGLPRQSEATAGGVGGLVSTTIYTGSNAGVYLPAFDGNGNVMALVNAANGASVAQYEYDSFGNLVQATGVMATANNILFSSKYFDWETGLYYYGYRYYNPNTGRWLSRDPIEEEGGANLYGFVGNSPISVWDLLGELPPSSAACKALARKIENVKAEIAKRQRELYEDGPGGTPRGLPGKVLGDDLKPSLSRRGHQRLLNMAKANLARLEALYAANCSDPEHPITDCLKRVVIELPGTPEQLKQAGAISTAIGVGIIIIIDGGEVEDPFGTEPSPNPDPVPTPQPEPTPWPIPLPAPFPV